jgi:hypothetical protein
MKSERNGLHMRIMTVYLAPTITRSDGEIKVKKTRSFVEIKMYK